jgi:uncharacterized damage-inducible protein DinB
MDNIFETQLSNRDFFVRRWKIEHAAFVDILQALPADRLDYRPHPNSRSAGELVALLVSLERSCVELCESGRGAYNTGLRLHSPSGAASLQEMIASYEQHHRALGEKLARLDDNTWNRQAWLTRGDQEILLRDSMGGLLWIALFDAIHHRGQLSTYIRPMGGKVPSIYGPSGDSPARE